MAIDYDKVMSFPPIVTRTRYSERDTILYALGLGIGADNPVDPQQLRFVYEKRLKALPSMAVVLATPGFWLNDPKYGFNWQHLLHAEQGLTLHRPLPVAGDVKTVVKIDDIYDKGTDKGALLVVSRELIDESDGSLLASLSQSYWLRADGGFGGKRAPSNTHAIPEREADVSVSLKTRFDQALIYRLSGDYNPLHIDPEVAAQAGFDKPILMGLCSYGMAARAAIDALCGGNPDALSRFDLRFSRPVFPGDILHFEFWCQGEGQAAFRATVIERGDVVLNNGYAEYKA